MRHTFWRWICTAMAVVLLTGWNGGEGMLGARPALAQTPSAAAPAEAEAAQAPAQEAASEAQADDTQADEAPAASGADEAADTRPRSRRGRDGSRGDGSRGGEPADDDGLVSLSFQNVTIEQLAKFLSEKTGKPVVPQESVKNTRITIVATQRMPLDEAMLILRQAMMQHGVIIEEYPRLLNLRPVGEALQSNLPVVGADVAVDTLHDPAMIVRKVFTAKHYDVLRLKDVIVPMLPDFAHVTADPNTRQLVVTDTVANLQRIAQVIQAMDVPMADQTITRILKPEHTDAAWVISVVRTMIAGSLGKQGLELVSGGGPAGGTPQRNTPQQRGGRPQRGGGTPPSGAGSAVIAIEQSNSPVLLMPEVSRNWIIAVAPPDVMRQIETWVVELDQPDNAETSYELLSLEHADAAEVAQYLEQAISSRPQQAGGAAVRVVPFAQQGKLLVFGSHRDREFIASLMEKLDVQSSKDQIMEVIELQNADASQVAENIQSLFSTQPQGLQSRWSRPAPRREGEVELKVAADARRNTVTIVTDAATMARIKQIVAEEWDKPLSGDDVHPKVYTLRHADPIQMRDLFTSMFSQESSSSSSFWDLYFGGGSKENPVGRLFGQFGFETMPDSNILVVTTKSSANYAVIDRLIEELDKPQDAGLPQLIELKHAYAEDLAEQLNAMLAEAGTLSEIRRNERDLTNTGNSNSVVDVTNNRNTQAQGGENSNPDTMTFWWQDARPRADVRPTSNLIGQIRIVPINRRNALLVLAPTAYLEPIHDLITELDMPGRQVIVHAVIAEIQHENATALGIRIAADPSILNDSRLLDQAIGATANGEFNELFGGTFAIGGDTFGRGVLNANLSVSALIQLLIRNFDLNILFEPKIYTADNQEAEFFDGQDVSVQVDSQITDTGNINRSFKYASIGTRLRVRPHITQNGDVDLMIDLELSRLVPGETIFGNPIFDRRETNTHVVVHNGQTVMLSGIITQESFVDVRKLPLLGDLPFIGGLFRSTENVKRNRELIAFITPHVVSTDPEEVDAAMEPYRKTLDRLRQTMPETLPSEPAPGADVPEPVAMEDAMSAQPAEAQP